MKNILRLLTLAVLLSFYSTVMLKANLKMNFSTIENTMNIKLDLASPTNQPIDFYILDGRERQIRTESIMGSTEYNKMIDLSELENGRYTLVTEIANQKYNQVIRVKDKSIEMKKSYYTYQPMFKIEDNMLHIHHIDERSDYVNINILDQFGGKYEREFRYDILFSEALSIESMQSGSYTLKLSSNGEVFSYNFEVLP